MDNSKKIEHLTRLAEYRHKLRLQPELKYLFFELTMRCNEHCLNCGSYCGDVESNELPVEVYYKILDQVKRDFKKLPMNREQKRKMPKNMDNPEMIRDVIKGPALVVTPIAVYQQLIICRYELHHRRCSRRLYGIS